MKAIPISKLEKFMMSQIDETNLVDVNKVYRYLQLTKNYRKLQTLVNKGGVADVVENKHQKYAKPHFALEEMRKIEKELQTIEKSLLDKTPKQNAPQKVRKPLINA